MKSSIVLTGPIGVGKSTQAKRLSEKLGCPICVYDEVKQGYRDKVGLSREKAHVIFAEDGLYAMLQYMNEFKSETLEPMMDDHPGHIIDLGAGAHAFDEPHQIERARKAFSSAGDVILLLPSDDLETNINYLPGIKKNFEINTFLMMHPTNTLLATKTVYTLNKTPEEVLQNILDSIGASK